jgi:branched-subunit amino acid transport protein
VNGFDAWILLLAAFAATVVWRIAGAVLAGRVSVDSRVFEWAGCVSYALVAGLMFRAIFLTEGPLASVPMTDRAIAVAAGLCVFMLTGRSVPKAVTVGTLLFALIASWRSGLFG